MTTIGDGPGSLVPPRDNVLGEDGWIGVNPLESATRSDVISHLADIAVRLARPLLWDPVKGRLERPMRKPWKM